MVKLGEVRQQERQMLKGWRWWLLGLRREFEALPPLRRPLHRSRGKHLAHVPACFVCIVLPG
jgi:hypothetical protein